MSTVQLFPQAAVDAYVRNTLKDYYKFDNVVSMTIQADQVIPPAVLVKFAELAKAWDGTIVQEYSTLYIRQGVSVERQRKQAVSEMQQAYERGEIDMSGKTREDYAD